VSRTGRRAVLMAAAAAAAVALLGNGGSEQEQAGAVVDPGSGETVGEFVYGLTPARLVDTRPDGSTVDGRERGAGPFVDGQTVTVAIAGRGGVPAGATSVLLNVTVVDPSGPGHLAVWPSGPHPGTSSVNFGGTAVVANLVFSALDRGSVTMMVVGGSTDVVVDVVGYLSDLPTAG